MDEKLTVKAEDAITNLKLRVERDNRTHDLYKAQRDLAELEISINNTLYEGFVQRMDIMKELQRLNEQSLNSSFSMEHELKIQRLYVKLEKLNSEPIISTADMNNFIKRKTDLIQKIKKLNQEISLIINYMPHVVKTTEYQIPFIDVNNISQYN